MCVVVDTNSMASVFRENSSDHQEFKPVLEWIVEGKGKLVIGGSKYLQEISSYLGLLADLKRYNKIVNVCSIEVDKEADFLLEKHNHRNYDDPHIIALLSVSKCKVICSKDGRATDYFKDRDLYRNKKVPSIYRSSKNRDLLIDNNLVDICLPCIRLNKEQKSKLTI